MVVGTVFETTVAFFSKKERVTFSDREGVNAQVLKSVSGVGRCGSGVNQRAASCEGVGGRTNHRNALPFDDMCFTGACGLASHQGGHREGPCLAQCETPKSQNNATHSR